MHGRETSVALYLSGKKIIRLSDIGGRKYYTFFVYFNLISHIRKVIALK